MNSKPDKLIPALYGGIVMALVSTIPFLNFVNCLCCAGILFGGLMAVYFYKNNFTPDTPPFTAGDCMGVGALAGLVGAVVGTMLSFIFLAMFGNVLADFLAGVLRNSNVHLPEEALQRMQEAMSGPFTFLLLFWRLFQNVILYTIFGLLGGLIGYSIFKPKQSPMMPPPPPSITAQ